MSRAMHPQAHRSSQRPRAVAPRAILAWGLVLAVAMLSFFVHLVSDHMARAQARSPHAAGAALAHTAQPSRAAPASPATPVLAVMR